ncbi:hypothetical protein Nepgr_008450 [Nepenthes gracilis]|uniref:Uncharacterized protein n=1 Tax=Nepenthes gracilis TaxID=150966 RepID=A0AAD3S931_NEPGR|nr:hypothetical protein Nepgr_008450 [Nepenthes gracilis]
MEANACDINHLDANVLLPPRKRLLAGLKKQNSENTSQPSPENLNSNVSREYDAHLKILLYPCKNSSNMSLEEIAEAAGSAAAAAARTAEAARAAAEEKAAIAARAVAAAKTALDLVASYSEEAGNKERHQKKNKLKKHVPVQLLYKRKQPTENCRTDEELARRLHQAMNSSPRISKHSLGSDLKNHTHKKLKISFTKEKGRRKFPSARRGDDPLREVDSEGFSEDSYIAKLHKDASISRTSDQVEEKGGEAKWSHKEKKFEALEDTYTIGRKRGRIKQKKMPLIFCSFKDQANPREQLNQSSLLSIQSVEVAPTWKCQDFNVSHCIKQNKVVQ